MKQRQCANCGNGTWTRFPAEFPKVCVACRFVNEDGTMQPSNWKPKPMTNADLIRAMSDKELADKVVCPHTLKWDNCENDCHRCRLHWLQQPAEEG